MRFSFNSSTLITEISRGWSTRPSLQKTRLRRWRRMARGKCHSLNSLREAARGLTHLNLDLSSDARTWFIHRCMVNVLYSRCSDRTFKHNPRTSRCRSLSSKHLDPMCNNCLARTCSKAPTLMLQPHIVHQLKEAVMVELVSSVV
jgi:hypothetical protein